MIKQKNLIIILVFVFSLTSCNLNVFSENNKKSLKSNEYLKEYGQKTIDAFIDKDIESLTDLFCDCIADSHDLNDEIEKAFEFIDGNIISYEKIDPFENGHTVEDGETTRLTGFCEVFGVKTDTGKKYYILLLCVLVYNKDASHIGVQKILVENIDYDGDNYLSYDTIDKLQIGEALEGSWN